MRADGDVIDFVLCNCRSETVETTTLKLLPDVSEQEEQFFLWRLQFFLGRFETFLRSEVNFSKQLVKPPRHLLKTFLPFKQTAKAVGTFM